jgi:SAM-dependent methyltransferase
MDTEEAVMTGCMVCGEDKFVQIGIENKIPLKKCLRCGIVHAATKDYDVREYYNDFFIEQDERSWHHFSQFVYDYNSKRLCSLKEKSKLLDIGSGYGHFMSLMSDLGWSTVGIEPAKTPATKALGNGLKVYNSFLEDVELGEKEFDAISLWWVLEHVQDPETFLKHVAKLMKPDGILISRVPNISFILFLNKLSFLNSILNPLINPVSNKSCFFDILSPPYHLWGYTRESMKTLLEKNGFYDIEFILGGRIRIQNPVRDILESALYSLAEIIYQLTRRRILFYHDMTVYAKRRKD